MVCAVASQQAGSCFQPSDRSRSLANLSGSLLLFLCKMCKCADLVHCCPLLDVYKFQENRHVSALYHCDSSPFRVQVCFIFDSATIIQRFEVWFPEQRQPPNRSIPQKKDSFLGNTFTFFYLFFFRKHLRKHRFVA